ncbi:hypothetical protein [Microbacterium marinilacus]|uniref:hypothetical protein n=1 Tax=Microbacterium marinilacus TaxID=415209 RepID=UPI001C8DECC6|nr:hypothetical protein [Microbacterium marinilacus]MBY0690378.1 hypothetical protein [Microbacterium marinilacus]
MDRQETKGSELARRFGPDQLGVFGESRKVSSEVVRGRQEACVTRRAFLEHDQPTTLAVSAVPAVDGSEVLHEPVEDVGSAIVHVVPQLGNAVMKVYVTVMNDFGPLNGVVKQVAEYHRKQFFSRPE